MICHDTSAILTIFLNPDPPEAKLEGNFSSYYCSSKASRDTLLETPLLGTPFLGTLTRNILTRDTLTRDTY